MGFLSGSLPKAVTGALPSLGSINNAVYTFKIYDSLYNALSCPIRKTMARLKCGSSVSTSQSDPKFGIDLPVVRRFNY